MNHALVIVDNQGMVQRSMADLRILLRGCSFFTLHAWPEYFDPGYETFPLVSHGVMKYFRGQSGGAMKHFGPQNI